MSQEVALIVGGGGGVSASCARLFASEGMQVAVAARTPDKPALQTLAARVPAGAGAGAAFGLLPPTQLLAHADSL